MYIESFGDFTDVRPGDTVLRDLFGQLMRLEVERIDDELIHTTSGHRFDRRTGFEDDPELGCGWRFGVTISRLIHPDRGTPAGEPVP